MAAPETVGHGSCGHCHKQVAVKKNAGGHPYYRCDFCGFEGRHHWHKTGAAFLQTVSPLGGCPAIVGEEREPEKSAPKTAEPIRQGKPATPAEPQKIAVTRGKFRTILDGEDD